jgi:predicted DNA-binding protein (MmcQ/YjbR family)
MTFEDNIFKRARFDDQKLVAYGFKLKNQEYYYSQNIFNNAFRIDVKISLKGQVDVQVIDLNLNEEYQSYRIKTMTGSFVGQVRDAITAALTDIKNNCSRPKYFIYDQTNRLNDLIFNKYQARPEFPWASNPGYAVYKKNNKWFGIIMNIPQSKIMPGNQEIEIINLKLPEELITTLLKQDGFYQAYHMNKSKWLSIILNNSITDSTIMQYIDISYHLARK